MMIIQLSSGDVHLSNVESFLTLNHILLLNIIKKMMKIIGSWFFLICYSVVTLLF